MKLEKFLGFLQSDISPEILFFFVLQDVAASFGFTSPPRVALKIDRVGGRGGEGYKSKRESVYNRSRGGRAGGKFKFERY